jgi:hypothetical protein
MSTKIGPLCGHFKKNGSSFSDEHRAFIVDRWPKPKPNNGTHFVVQKDKAYPKGIFISTLFWKSSTTAKLDWQGVDYELKVDGDEVTIEIS